jgi:hypothetical protein
MLRKGFIYFVRPARKSYIKSDAVLEFEEIAEMILTDREAVIYQTGYEVGKLDQEYDDQMKVFEMGLTNAFGV